MATVIADKFYTVKEACAILKLTRQGVCALIKSGQLQADKAHHMLWLIPEQSLLEFKKIKRPRGQHIEFRKSNRAHR